MSKSVKLTALDLLVAISGLLETEHYPRLGPMLWTECLLDPLGTTAAAVSCRPCGQITLINDDIGLFPLHAVRRKTTGRVYPVD